MNQPCKHARNALSARLASRLSPSRLSARLALSQNSLTCAKCKNGAKRDVEVESLLKLDLHRMKDRPREMHREP